MVTTTPDYIAYRLAGRDGMHLLELWGDKPTTTVLAAAIAEEHQVPDQDVQFIHTAIAA